VKRDAFPPPLRYAEEERRLFEVQGARRFRRSYLVDRMVAMMREKKSNARMC
jgi:hypothetical protein